MGNRVRGVPFPGRRQELARLGTSLGFACFLLFLYGLLAFVVISALSYIPYVWLSLSFFLSPLLSLHLSLSNIVEATLFLDTLPPPQRHTLPRITVHMLLASLARLGCHQHPDIHNHRSYFWLAFFTSSLWRKLHSRRLWQYADRGAFAWNDDIRREAQRHHLSGAGTGKYK